MKECMRLDQNSQSVTSAGTVKKHRKQLPYLLGICFANALSGTFAAESSVKDCSILISRKLADISKEHPAIIATAIRVYYFFRVLKLFF